MVIAGTKNRNTKGASRNNPSRLAYPKSIMFDSSGNTHRNKPFTSKKTMITIYPIKEFKNPLTSLI
jgi:hypothetical protein